MGIYRKLAAMLAPLPGLMAAVLVSPLVLGHAVVVPSPALVETVVGRVVAETATALAARRGVRLLRPVKVSLVDRARMLEARAAAEQDSPASPGSSAAAAPSRAIWRQVVFEHLGFGSHGDVSTGPGAMPAREDAHALERRPLASDQPVSPDVTGMFDVRRGRLLLANWADLAAGRFALTRDLAYALLDRRFSLSRWGSSPSAGRNPSGVAADTDTTDALLSRQATLHGDATVQALESLDPQSGLPAPRALSRITADLRASLRAETEATSDRLELQRRLFLELDGLTFVAHFRARLPWTEVDELWRRPAVSSEQVLHPEKYEQQEQPDPVSRRLPASPPPKSLWHVVLGDTLGEWGVRSFLEREGDAYRAQRAAAGWGGDRLLLLGPATGALTTAEASPTNANTNANANALSTLKTVESLRAETFIVWITTWDDETDAADFAAEAARALAALAGVALLDDRPPSGRLQLSDAAGRLFAIDRRRRAVGLLVAAPRGASELLAHFMAAATPAPPRPAGRPPGRQGRR